MNIKVVSFVVRVVLRAEALGASAASDPGDGGWLFGHYRAGK